MVGSNLLNRLKNLELEVNKQTMRVFTYWSHGYDGAPYVYEARGERRLSSDELQKRIDDSTLSFHVVFT
jgi:hypothetical protein